MRVRVTRESHTVRGRTYRPGEEFEISEHEYRRLTDRLERVTERAAPEAPKEPHPLDRDGGGNSGGVAGGVVGGDGGGNSGGSLPVDKRGDIEEELREAIRAKGGKPDGRWGEARLRKELEALS